MQEAHAERLGIWVAVWPVSLLVMSQTLEKKMQGVHRKCDGLLVTLALGHHGPGHPRNLVGQRDGATFVGRRANNAVSQGRCLVPWILA